MRKAERNEMIQLEIDRTISSLGKETPGSGEYRQLLDCLNNLLYIANSTEEVSIYTGPGCPVPVTEENLCLGADPGPSDEPLQAAAEAAEEAPNEGDSHAPAEEDRPVDRIALRAKMADAKSKGVDTSKLIQSFGVHKYSNIPDDQLWKLEDMLAEELKGLSA